MRTLPFAVLALALLAGCGESIAENRPPLDRLFSPTGIAVAPRPGGGGDLLYVVNSNFTLDYAAEDGGTVLAIDPDASIEPPGGGIAPPAVVGAVRIPSYGGEIAIAHPGLPGCESLPGTMAIVPVRYTNETYVLDVAADGDSVAITCADEGCRFPSQDTALDPFGVTVVCRPNGGAVRASAFVAHLSGASQTGAPTGYGFVTEIDLLARAAATPLNLGAGPTAQLVWDPSRGLLFASPSSGTPGYAPLRWWRPDGIDPFGGVDFSLSDVNAYIPNAIVRGMALSSDRSRLYLTIDQYDATYASLYGSIVIRGAVLLALDITESVLGQQSLRPARAVPLGGGLGRIGIVPRVGKRDLLVLPDTTGHKVHVYDDEAGALVTTFNRDALGRYIIREPFAVAPQALPGGAWRVWVGSFRDGTITAIEFDDPNRPGTARIGKRIGNSE